LHERASTSHGFSVFPLMGKNVTDIQSAPPFIVRADAAWHAPKEK
jgi:hypothetical protein